MGCMVLCKTFHTRDRGRHLLSPIVLVKVLVPVPDTASLITPLVSKCFDRCHLCAELQWQLLFRTLSSVHTSPHMWNIRPAALCSMRFLRYPDGCPRLCRRPVCRKPGRFSFIQFGQSPRLQRFTKCAHSNSSVALATTGACWNDK